MTPAKAPLFITGSGRCGTTLLFQALAAHPEVGLTNESHVADFLWFAARLAGIPDDVREDFEHEEPLRLRGYVTREFAARFGAAFAEYAPRMLADFYERLFPGRPLRWYGDKMPNPRVAWAVADAVPGTRVVALVRDPYDYVCSARSYARRGDVARAYPHLDVPVRLHAEHWRNVNGEAISRQGRSGPIRYEELVREPEAVTRRVLRSLDLDPVPECLRALKEGAWFARHGTSPTPEASVGRARRELTPEDARVVGEVCGEVAAALGYPRWERGAGAD